MNGREILRKYKAGKRNFSRVKLRQAKLEGASLRNVDLSWAYLRGAQMSDADLTGADLTGCDLVDVNLQDARLNEANLRFANLYNADVTHEQLIQAKSLKGTILPDGTRHQYPVRHLNCIRKPVLYLREETPNAPEVCPTHETGRAGQFMSIRRPYRHSRSTDELC